MYFSEHVHVLQLASRFVAPEDLNAGFLDQRLALQFLQQNVASFGGDPTKVTCWGQVRPNLIVANDFLTLCLQSAGAGSCQTHVLFPAKERLFRSVISDSSTGP